MSNADEWDQRAHEAAFDRLDELDAATTPDALWDTAIHCCGG